MKITISNEKSVKFNNNTFYCIGTGRMGLALQKNYYEQLKFVQEKIGFEHIRGHGLFCKDMAIYQTYKDANDNEQVEYNFTYLDVVMDSYKELKIRPFIELGFMPDKLASGEQTIFYWKGNVTPPKDYTKWTNLVKATLTHLCNRYGKEEVVTWPVEVWNEPNLPGFWKGADMNEYFKLYDCTSRAVKEVDSRFKVGGPAVCGVKDQEWISEFLKFVEKNNSPIDFVTRHHYTTEMPSFDGHYGYPKLNETEHCFDQLVSTRPLVNSFKKFKDMDIHITEYNTSYIGNAPVHDTNLNAAYIANMLSLFGDEHQSYSYWTFGDVFEEGGVPYTPFHGGFGLVANGMIPKPTFWTFAFYKYLQKDYVKCVLKNKNSIICMCKDGDKTYYKGILWNIDLNFSGKELELSFEFPFEKSKEELPNVLITHLIDEEVCNPLKVWHDIGESANPSKEEIQLIKDSAQPLIKTKRVANQIDFTLKENAVCYFEIKAQPIISDRGYTYGRME